MFKGRVEVLPEDGPDAASDAVEHRLRLRRKRQSVVEVPGGRYYKLNYACELVNSANNPSTGPSIPVLPELHLWHRKQLRLYLPLTPHIRSISTLSAVKINLQKNSFWLRCGLLTFIWKGKSHRLPCLDLMQVVHFFIAEATSLNRTGTSQPSMSFPYKNAQPSLTLEPHGPRAWWIASCSQRPPWAEQRNRWWLSQPLASPASTDPDELCMSTKIT